MQQFKSLGVSVAHPTVHMVTVARVKILVQVTLQPSVEAT